MSPTLAGRFFTLSNTWDTQGYLHFAFSFKVIQWDFWFGFVFLSNMGSTCSLAVRCEEKGASPGSYNPGVAFWKLTIYFWTFFFLSSFESKVDLQISCNDVFGLEWPVSDSFASLPFAVSQEWVTCLPVNQREAEWRVTGNLLGKGRGVSFNKSFTFIWSVCPIPDRCRRS